MKSSHIGIAACLVLLLVAAIIMQAPKSSTKNIDNENKIVNTDVKNDTIVATTTKEVATTSVKTITNITTKNNMNEQKIGGMVVVDEVVGTGVTAVAGDKVTVDYVGSLTNGKVFDASKPRGDQGFSFTLGAGQVIKGWDLGVAGMKVGGKRKLTIPADMAYGSQDVGNGLIPANSTLIFEVELRSTGK
jgi:peptidylprolyl isomerase/FKBP-type peptidyl-prolyl cis-trans isomerase FkpA